MPFWSVLPQELQAQARAFRGTGLRGRDGGESNSHGHSRPRGITRCPHHLCGVVRARAWTLTHPPGNRFGRMHEAPARPPRMRGSSLTPNTVSEATTDVRLHDFLGQLTPSPGAQRTKACVCERSVFFLVCRQAPDKLSYGPAVETLQMIQLPEHRGNRGTRTRLGGLDDTLPTISPMYDRLSLY